MDNTSWSSLKNVVLALAAVSGGVAGFAARYCMNAPYTAEWRLHQYEASVGPSRDAGGITGVSNTAVQ